MFETLSYRNSLSGYGNYSATCNGWILIARTRVFRRNFTKERICDNRTLKEGRVFKNNRTCCISKNCFREENSRYQSWLNGCSICSDVVFNPFVMNEILSYSQLSSWSRDGIRDGTIHLQPRVMFTLSCLPTWAHSCDILCLSSTSLGGDFQL